MFNLSGSDKTGILDFGEWNLEMPYGFQGNPGESYEHLPYSVTFIFEGEEDQIASSVLIQLPNEIKEESISVLGLGDVNIEIEDANGCCVPLSELGKSWRLVKA